MLMDSIASISSPPMYRPNISMIVFRKSDGKFLIVHKPRKHHTWQFPQGGIESGESHETAAKRELKEELGTEKFQDFQQSKHVLFYDFPLGYEKSGGFKGHKQSYFLTEFTGQEGDIVVNPTELDDHRWVYQNELSEYLESKDYEKKINQVIFEFRHLL